MWRQWLEQPGFRGAMGERLTYLTFPDPWWGKLPTEERTASLEDWFRRSREPGFAEELEALLQEAVRRAAEDYHLWARSEQLTVQAIRQTRVWRTRERARQCAAAASAARQASRSALSGPRSRSRSEISGSEQGQAIPRAGSSQRQPSSSAGSHSWLTA